MYEPSEVLVAILRVVYPKNFGGDIIKIHKIFYGLRNKFPEIMDNFRFTKRINPFCVTLDGLIKNFQLTGILQQSSPDRWSFKVNPKKLKEFPENNKLLDSFKDLKELRELCV